jgi:hypothetical protein
VAKRLARYFTFGRSRVLTPVPPDQVWVFSEVSPHHHIVVSLISQIRRMLVSINLSVPTTFPFAPNLPVNVAGKAMYLSLFVPVQYLSSIFFETFHQSFPICIFQIVFGFSCPFPLLLFTIFPLKSPLKCIRSTYPVFFSLRLHLFTVCHYFPPFIAYMNFSFHASFFFSLFFSLFFDPQFHPCYYSLGSSSLFLSFFLPLDLTICTLSVEAFPFVLLFRFPSTFLFTFSLYLFSPVRLLFFSLSSSKNVYSVSSLSYPR